MKNKIRHRRQITIETHSLTIIRTGGKKISAFCERCQTNVLAFTPEQIAAFLDLIVAEICLRVQSDELHLIKTGRSVALICGGSLSDEQTSYSLKQRNEK